MQKVSDSLSLELLWHEWKPIQQSDRAWCPKHQVGDARAIHLHTYDNHADSIRAMSMCRRCFTRQKQLLTQVNATYELESILAQTWYLSNIRYAPHHANDCDSASAFTSNVFLKKEFIHAPYEIPLDLFCSWGEHMSLLLGCIADDFTGATDLANNLVRAGMRVVQTIGVPDAPCPLTAMPLWLRWNHELSPHTRQ